MDRERLKEVHQTDLTESKVNEDFVEWLKTKGPSWLLFGLLGICAYLLIVRFKQHQVNYQNTAWAEMFQADLPGSYEDVAREYDDVGQIANLARIRAADQLLESVQSGTTLDAPAAQRGETTPPALLPEHMLSPEQREQYLTRAAGLYDQVIDLTGAGKGVKIAPESGTLLYVVGAYNGKAAVAECLGDAAAARAMYEKAAAAAESYYPGLADQARARAQTAGDFSRAIEFRTEAELRALNTPPTPPTPVRVDSALRDLIMPDESE